MVILPRGTRAYPMVILLEGTRADPCDVLSTPAGELLTIMPSEPLEQGGPSCVDHQVISPAGMCVDLISVLE